MRTNTPIVRPPVRTHEGGTAARINGAQELRRSVMSCFLWEGEFYESGEEIGARIVRLAHETSPQVVSDLAIEARTKGNLRHVPLVLASALASHPLRGVSAGLVSFTIANVVQRADELSEFVAIHAKLNKVAPDKVKKTLSAQVKKGLAAAFTKFNAYALAKYNRDGAVKLRDVLFLSHAKPKDEAQAATFKQLIDGTLPTPDTWETELSAGKDKKETFERLIRDRKLGYFALIRNLRNMAQAGCDPALVKHAIRERNGGAEKILPFRFIAAARACPQFEPDLDASMLSGLAELPTLPGLTVVLVDVSGSMDHPLGGKSDLMRIDAASGLASIWPGSLRVFTFSNAVIEVPPRRGMAGIDAIKRSQSHQGTYLAKAITALNQSVKYDRLVVITDEQSHDGIALPLPNTKAYLINVASNRRGVGYGKNWIHIDGFSENTIKYIYELETTEPAETE